MRGGIMEGRSLFPLDDGAAVLAITCPELGRTLLETWFDPRRLDADEAILSHRLRAALSLNNSIDFGVRCANIVRCRPEPQPQGLHVVTVEFAKLFHLRTEEAVRITREDASYRGSPIEEPASRSCRPMAQIMTWVFEDIASRVSAQTPVTTPLCLVIPNTVENHALVIDLWDRTLERIRHEGGKSQHHHQWSEHV